MGDAVVSELDDVEVTRVRNSSGEWANFSLREWKAPDEDKLGRSYGGELTVASSYGTWSYVWGSPGMPFKEFVVKSLAKDWHYTMKKLVGENKIRGFSLEETQKRVREKILERRREDGIHGDREAKAQAARRMSLAFRRYSNEPYVTKELAAEAWEELKRAHDEHSMLDVIQNFDFLPIFGHEAYDLIAMAYHDWIKHFWSDLFIPYAKYLAKKNNIES